jgi:hypothetical protein
MSVNNTVITTLRERLDLDRQIDALIEIHSEKEFLAQARRLAESGNQVIPVVLQSLQRANPRHLNALGVIASLYPRRGEILNKLYEAAEDVERSDRERVSAMLILERFLDQTPDPYLLQTLENPRAVAVESIRDLIRASERDPSVLLDYTRALSEQPVEAITGIVDTLLDVGQERAVPVLCLMSQADDEAIAAMALNALGQIRHPKAVRGLQSLLPILAHGRRPLGERSLRKLQFSGLNVDPPPAVDPAWRALVGPIDGQGNQVVWFIRDPDADGKSRFLGLALNDGTGFSQAYGNANVPARALPTRHSAGHVHLVPMQFKSMPHQSPRPETSFLHMLEADLDYGRRLVRDAQQVHFGQNQSLPAAYRLLGPLIWQYDATSVDTSRQQPPVTAQSLERLSNTARLPYHPFFRGWIASGSRATARVEAGNSLTPLADHEVVRDWASRLAGEYFDETTLQQVEARLWTMSEWLWRAKQTPLAELASVAAQTVGKIPPAQHPFLLSMAELGLNLAVMHSSQ